MTNLKQLQFIQKGDSFHIEGYPKAVKVVKLTGPVPDRLKSMVLHQDDLQFALEALLAINGIPVDNYVVRESLWNSAITKFFKCFKSSKSRTKLSKEEVYAGQNDAIEALHYFESLRDKHLVHDENAYSQAHIGAILNNSDAERKVADIVSSVFSAHTLDQSHWGSFHKLVSYAREWVLKQIEDLHNQLAEEYEQRPYEELIDMESVQYVAPMSEEIAKNRKTQ